MLRSAFTRWIILGGALLATVVASVWPKGQESRTIEVVRPASERERAPPRQPPPLEDAALPAVGVLRGRQNDEAEIRDLFGPKSWNTPPPRAPQKPSPPAPPPAPMAPPFPYSITGKVVDANGTMIVFANQNQHFAVRAGELLEQTYRVDAIDSQTVTVTYLPLGLTQRLPIGESN
jgi:hypothetical protein